MTAALAVLLASCGGGESGSSDPAITVATTTAATTAATTTTTSPFSRGVPRCDAVPPVVADPGDYAPTPMYFANEMPTETLELWAKTLPGFEAIWIDREHNGWITVAFSSGADLARFDLDLLFPEVGAVVVEVPWKRSELLALQDRATSELRAVLPSFGAGADLVRGVVEIDVGPLTPEILAFLNERYAGERVCVSGIDPATLPPPGPQPEFGAGWRLLADAPHVGHPYRTGIATDAASLAAMWDEIGLTTPPPEVDFTVEVVIWFGAVFSGSCPGIRLDDVVVDGATVFAEIVQVEWAAYCTADANPRAYVVALERTRLPHGPFSIQLDRDGPTLPEERTIVDADLSGPGAVATPDQIHRDTTARPPPLVESGDIIEPGFPVDFRLDTSCGIEWLGELNFYTWRTTEELPAAWEALIDDGQISVSVTLLLEPEARITATAGGSTVTYRPTNDPRPPCP